MFYCGGYALEQQLQTFKHSYAHNHAYTSEVRALNTPPLNIEGAMRPAQKKGGVVHEEFLATDCWAASHSDNLQYSKQIRSFEYDGMPDMEEKREGRTL